MISEEEFTRALDTLLAWVIDSYIRLWGPLEGMSDSVKKFQEWYSNQLTAMGGLWSIVANLPSNIGVSQELHGMLDGIDGAIADSSQNLGELERHVAHWDGMQKIKASGIKRLRQTERRWREEKNCVPDVLDEEALQKLVLAGCECLKEAADSLVETMLEYERWSARPQDAPEGVVSDDGHRHEG